MKKQKERKPKVGETVYLRNEKNAPAMVLVKITNEKEVEFGYCIWKTTKLVKGEQKSKDHDGSFPLAHLTTIAPPFLSEITLG